MKALLIDDEQSNLDNLRILITTYCPQVNVCGAAADTRSATSLLHSHQPDLVFLDIQMPEQSGFDWLRSLSRTDFEIIFVTAYDQYAVQAMRLSAIDYLLKPVSIEELQAAVDRAYQQHSIKKENQLLNNLRHFLKGNNTPAEQSIALATLKETRFVKIKEITRCKSANNYTTFYLATGESLLICKPIFFYDDLLRQYGFVRCHQSHLVNKASIKSWKRDSGDFLVLTNGAEIPISRGKKEEVKRLLQN
ncbi:LytTR family DNA-binding domain-containing protein [Dyadobacter sp. LJ53]|uniref:LytR/AlgR family response regulator transcription factor n=1 Tax=Dyadobacter chenwenxiniae TaxID=2906456 RepID=UPI001F47B2E3|nr:LytTR family DNA-binding domain-containing protein [Dyadobacter chenwenxiniae]MCF0048486.1 LytTR family DNA-binding domain-containing protein [Dyadobacter chenwenxiniae]